MLIRSWAASSERLRALWSGVLEDVQVGRVEVVVAGFVPPPERVPLHRLEGHAEEGADQRRPEGLLPPSS